LAAGFDSSGSAAVAGAPPRKVDAPDVEAPVFDRDLEIAQAEARMFVARSLPRRYQLLTAQVEFASDDRGNSRD
jgi:hypothetical protein